MSEIIDALAKVLEAKYSFQLVSHVETTEQVRLIGRLPKEQASNWVIVRHGLLLASEKSSWRIDLSRVDLLKDGQLVWAWRLIFQHPDIATQVDSIISVLNNQQRSSVEVTSVSLGTGVRSMMGSNGKGAQLSGVGGGIPPILQRR